MRIVFLLLFSTVIFVACNEQKELRVQSIAATKPSVNLDSLKKSNTRSTLDSIIHAHYLSINLVDVKHINANILVDLKYATNDNFMHRVLYDTLRHAFLNKEIAERLSNCQNYLDSIQPGFHLLVFDAVRPLGVQSEMWFSLDSIPYSRRGKFVSNPKYGSVHNYGAAVDLTIIDSNGNELDMGAGYDDFRPIAFPSKEKYFLDNGELTLEQVNNRRLLRRVMRSQKFYNIPSEWWHFNGFSRVTASKKYKCLMNESGEVDWFIISPPVVEDSTIDIPMDLKVN